MKWLFATSVDVSKPISGGAIMSRTFYESFVELWGRESLVIAPKGSGNFFRQTGCEICFEAEERSRWEKIIGLLAYDRDRVGCALDKLVDQVRDFGPAIAVVDVGTMGGAVQRLHKWGVPIISLHHNDEMEYRMHSTGSHIAGWDAGRVQRFVLLHSRLAFTLTQRDTELLGKLCNYRTSLHTIGYGEFATAGDISVPLPAVNMRLCLTGNFGVAKGYSGLVRLVELIDGLPEAMPKPEVLLGGYNFPEAIRAICQAKGFTILKQDEALQRADIYVNPSEHPGGMKIRNCDGGRAGLPMLLHVNSLPGFECFKGDFVEGFSSAEGFSQGLALLGEKVRSRKLTRAGIRKRYYEVFSRQAMLGRMKEALRRTVGERQ